MSRRLKPFPVLEGDQRRASDPSAHAALSASAGTGKTQVLTARVLRLLLGQVDPGAILCLTFTKAGAAEMANRIAARLAAWVRMPDLALGHDLFALGENHAPPDLQRARRLFARVLETPGGLRIQTIHGFAQTLLASFPAEAGINPGFQPIEGRAEAELTRRTLASLLADAEASHDDALIADVQALSLRLGEGGAQEYLTTCARSEEMIDALGDPAGFEATLLQAIGITEANATDAIAAELADEEIDRPTIEELIAVNRQWPTATGATIATNLTAFLAATPAERIGLLDTVGKKFVTAQGEPCKASTGQIKVHPDYAELLSEFAHWLTNRRRRRCAAEFASTQAAGLRAGQAFARAYRLAKRAAGVADFDDLIAWTRRLLRIDGMGEWVRFKLDQRTDHILVDEAQDTNADQWAIVDALASEYFSGQSETELRWRTLFMVGDYKQAIFGFQGTDPRQFDAFRQTVADRAAAAGEAAQGSDSYAREFRDLSIDASFRSSPPILQLVDALIDEVGHGAMGLSRRPNRHAAAHGDRPGEVLWWPPFSPADAEDAGEEGEEGWVAEPVRLYADALARQIKAWLDEAAPLACTGRPLSAGDILILVRSRSELASLLVARLYAHGVPVAGIDRLHLSKPLAVKDLLAAIGFAVQPHDDLTLAGLLVSPIVGWDQDQLRELAFGRSGSLWSALQGRRDDDQYRPAFDLLSNLLASADFVTPARFLENLLSGATDARRKLLARLGEAARDPIEELVASALEFEAQEGVSLDRFLAWFSRGEVEVKRDPSSAGDAVRVMTVHGAKGLEAPLVILADATHDPDRVGRRPPSLDLPLGNPRRPIPLLRPRTEEQVSPYTELIEAQRESDRQEHWRLLYVGLTRAAERLIITGVQPSRGDVVEYSWHSRSAAALAALGGVSHPGPWGEGLSWHGTERPRFPRLRVGRRTLDRVTVPDWARRPAPQEERPPRPLSPSSIGPDRDALPPPSPELRAAAERGTMLHSLFERLPAVAPDERRPAALAYLARTGLTDPSRASEIVDAALAVIEDPRFADLFMPDALAEAPIAATLPDGRVIAGTVDRLCIAADVVRVIDFKTGRAVPGSAAALPAGHVAQMLAYAAALGVIFPGRRIEAALLYTHGPSLIALPA
ncbi:MAG: double-strand break repair helicase AddA [Pseudomonadota bacterium]|nr:double-strand break repair helicase AddA [Pseudomonadota bacterium]